MSMPFKNILFPFDFSNRARAIVPHVQAACDRFHASLTLLHLVEVPALAYGSPESPIMFDFPAAQLKDCAEQRLTQFAADAFPGPPVRVVVEEGDPGSCIAELARNLQTDLIMMPTRGCGQFRAALLGSVTAKTLHDADCAVWTEAHCEEAGAEHSEWRSIVCAIDTVPEGLRLIRSAAELATNCGATVHLVHAVPAAAEKGPAKYFDLEFSAFLEQEARETIAGMQKEAGTNFVVCTGAGNITDVVRHAAVGHNADLVLIGRGELPHFAGRLRSQTYAIVRDMPCPVLSV
jgi:nucleotide-binding universal stress UspA family protein